MKNKVALFRRERYWEALCMQIMWTCACCRAWPADTKRQICQGLA